MTLSIWRYSHLVLAVSCFIFLTIASVTGVVLGIDAAGAPRPPYSTSNTDSIHLNVLIPRLQSEYMEINHLEMEDHQFVTIKALDNDGKEINGYVNPKDGKYIAPYKEKSKLIQWTTSLHRSLFLHETGRFFIGLSSLLLVLITVSGIMLVVKQQAGVRRFFSSFSREYFSQYYHVLLGRLFLIPILIIALTGTYLSLERFGIIPEKKIELKTPENGKESEQLKITDFKIFQQITLGEIRSIDFPFADDPDEYYKIKLKDKEILVNQFNGTIVSEVKYPLIQLFNIVSLNLHTGKTSIGWAVILTIASFGILFFIYSGFVITFKRRANKIKNKYKIEDASIIMFVGSENGSTIHFANAILKQLISHGKKVYLTELNNFKIYPNTQEIIIFTATFGLGDAPTNASKFLALLENTQSDHTIKYSVVGFGSDHYPDFCGYAKTVNEQLEKTDWAVTQLPLYSINDKSLKTFTDWVKAWADIAHIPLISSENHYSFATKKKQNKFIVVNKTEINEGDQNFILTIKPISKNSFQSGDLLAIYPENNEKERLYSIGKIGRNIQLVVKLHPNGLGSSYLYHLEKGQILKGAIESNHGFHIQKKQPTTIMISNGTGIAPFLGMLDQNKNSFPAHLYAGFQKNNELQKTVVSQLQRCKEMDKLKDYQIAFSREDSDIRYVYHLIEKDMDTIIQIMENGGIMFFCGSLAMYRDVTKLLEYRCTNFQKYISNNQIKSDCY